MTVAIVTPWHEHRELWPDYEVALSVANADELWIIDNGSQPPLDFATLRLDRNTGFCGGCNAGLHATQSLAVVFLNNDVSLLEADWLDHRQHGCRPERLEQSSKLLKLWQLHLYPAGMPVQSDRRRMYRFKMFWVTLHLSLEAPTPEGRL